jgi:hypothetical protein
MMNFEHKINDSRKGKLHSDSKQYNIESSAISLSKQDDKHTKQDDRYSKQVETDFKVFEQSTLCLSQQSEFNVEVESEHDFPSGDMYNKNCKINENINSLKSNDQDKCLYKRLGISALKKCLDNAKGLSIAHLNVRSVPSKIDELRFLLSQIDLDLFCCTETWLDNTVCDKEIDINSYNIYRNDRNRHGGGACIYVKEQLTHKPRYDLGHPEVECTWVECQGRKNQSPILVGALYRPPNASAAYYDSIVEMLNKVSKEGKEIIILGDFNYNYVIDETLANNPVKYLQDVFALDQLVNEPTRVTMNSSSILDLILTTDQSKHIRTGVHKIGISDHHMCFTIIGFDKDKYVHKTIKYRDYTKFSVNDFINDLEKSGLDEICLLSNLEDAWQKWKTTFLLAANKHCPFTERRVKNRSNSWITPDLIKLMYRRDYLKEKAVISHDADLWVQYKKVRNKINNTIKRAKLDYYTNLVDENKSDSKSFWRKLGRLWPNKRQNSFSPPKDLSADDLNKYFVNIGKNTVKEGIEMNGNCEFKWNLPDSIYDFNFRKVIEDDILKSLHSLSDSKSNIDILSFDAKLLRLSADFISPQITHLVNLSIENCQVVDDWKVARVTPIYKGKGDNSELGNYRPISVICHVGKMVEKQIQLQLIDYLTAHDFISVDQSAYLKDHSTQTSLHRVNEDWLEAMNHGQLIGACFLDISKCFDTIDNELLLLKLSKYGIRGSEHKWFESYFMNRGQCVNHVTLSDSLQVDLGVPQGSILGPLLFLLYTNDLSTVIGDASCNCFADDTVIYVCGDTVAEVRSKLQACVQRIEQWYNINRLVVNASKSFIMLLGTEQRLKRIDDDEFFITFGKQSLDSQSVVTYLGIQVDRNLNWDSHLVYLNRKVGPKLHLMRRLSTFLPESLLSQIYTTYLQPVVEYAATVWGYCSDKNLHIINRLQGLAARICTKNYDFVNVRSAELITNLKWKTFKERRDFLMASLMHKCIYGKAPFYLTSNLNLVSDVAIRNTRGSGGMDLLLPRPRIDKYKNSLVLSGGHIWNNLPKSLKVIPTIKAFKVNYKKELWYKDT